MGQGLAFKEHFLAFKSPAEPARATTFKQTIFSFPSSGINSRVRLIDCLNVLPRLVHLFRYPRTPASFEVLACGLSSSEADLYFSFYVTCGLDPRNLLEIGFKISYIVYQEAGLPRMESAESVQ
jgi:hypothetical protein